jgi:hypothetical protein
MAWLKAKDRNKPAGLKCVADKNEPIKDKVGEVDNGQVREEDY